MVLYNKFIFRYFNDLNMKKIKFILFFCIKIVFNFLYVF